MGAEGLWSRWNLDPLLLLALLAVATAWLMWTRGMRTRQESGFAAAALAALLVAFVSPLCAAASSLFSARAAHHLVLIAIAAPLMAAALPRHALRRLARRIPLGGAAMLNAVILWLWHAPGLYSWILSSDAAYWTATIALLGAALLLWIAALGRGLASPGALAGLAATVGQMGLLGALITFAPQPLYDPHAVAPFLWGLTPLADQQLAGLIMWVPSAAPYAVIALIGLMRWLDTDGQDARP